MTQEHPTSELTLEELDDIAGYVRNGWKPEPELTLKLIALARRALRSPGSDGAWRDAIEAAAKIADNHKGSAAAKRRVKGQQFKFLPDDVVAEIAAEERGEDIAAEIIARAIRALPPTPLEKENGQQDHQERMAAQGHGQKGRAERLVGAHGSEQIPAGKLLDRARSIPVQVDGSTGVPNPTLDVVAAAPTPQGDTPEIKVVTRELLNESSGNPTAAPISESGEEFVCKQCGWYPPSPTEPIAAGEECPDCKGTGWLPGDAFSMWPLQCPCQVTPAPPAREPVSEVEEYSLDEGGMARGRHRRCKTFGCRHAELTDALLHLVAEREKLRKDNKRIRYCRNKSGRDQHSGIEALKAEIAAKDEALEKVRAAILEHAPDTLWVGLIETAVDCIDAARSHKG